VPGRKGFLDWRSRGPNPVFAGDVAADPELRYFVAFQDAKAVLVIRCGLDSIPSA